MKKLLLCFMICGFAANSQTTPIFTPSMSITTYGSVNSPANEQVEKIIDGSVNTKFLDFNEEDGMGFTVDLGGQAMVASTIVISTANDHQERDPQNYEVLGSNDGVNFNSIATGSIPCISTRYHTRTFSFSNTNAYTYYRIIYSTRCGVEYSIQISETQLLGYVLGLNNYSLESALKITPNPNNGSFILNNNNKVGLDYAVLMDLKGQKLKTIDLKDSGLKQEIDLSLASGVYFLNIMSNSTRILKKIIIK